MRRQRQITRSTPSQTQTLLSVRDRGVKVVKQLILLVGSILIGVALYLLLVSGNNSVFGASKNAMQKNIEYVNQVP